MKLTVALIFVCLVSSSLGNPSDQALSLRQGREVDFIGNTQLLVKELVQNLRNAAQESFNAIIKFNEGLQNQGKLFAEKIVNDVKAYRVRFDNAIKGVTDRFTNAGAAIGECVETFKSGTDKIFSNTVEKAMTCADERIKEIAALIEELRDMSLNVTEFAKRSVDELKNCKDTNTGLLSTGSCFGGVAIRTELKGAVYLTQSALLISRISLSLTSLPAALEVCAGVRLVAAGFSATKSLVDIGTCSASSVYTTLTGNKKP